MRSSYDIEDLNRTAVEYFKEYKVKKVAVAVSGSEESLILLNAAAQSLGRENVIALMADTGVTNSKVINIIESACAIVNVEFRVIPVYFYDDIPNGGDVTASSEYKQRIFEELLQEAWLLGFDNLAYACTKENYAINGNEVISTFDSVLCPLYNFN